MRLSQIREMGIKTSEGQRHYQNAIRESGRIQAQREKYEEGSKEFKRLTNKDIKVLREALAEALAMNPKPKKAVGKLRFR